MNWYRYSVGFLVIVGIIATHIIEVEAIQDSTEFGVWARCDPHSQVTVPQQVSIQVLFTSSQSTPIAKATMNSFGEKRFETSSQTPMWGTPQKGWVAFMLEGPPISGNYYCQTDWGPKRVHLSYATNPNIKLYLSPDGQPTPVEMDAALQGNRSMLTIAPTAGSTTYEAGHNSATPYWLEVALPVYDTQSASTTMYNEFL